MPPTLMRAIKAELGGTVLVSVNPGSRILISPSHGALACILLRRFATNKRAAPKPAKWEREAKTQEADFIESADQDQFGTDAAGRNVESPSVIEDPSSCALFQNHASCVTR